MTALPTGIEGTSGEVRPLSPEVITAAGKERSRLVQTWFGGAVLAALSLAYVYLAANSIDTHALLTFLATAYGVYVGRKLGSTGGE